MKAPEIHRAARADRAFHRWRARRAREAGAVAYVVPHTGYGSTDWIRVLGRVLLTKDPARPASEPTGLRGWRNFINVPVENATVEVHAGSSVQTVQADFSGIIDVKVDVDLSPGWHEIGLSSEGSSVAVAKVFVVDPELGFGMVSDIDDTVMVTALPRPFLAAWHTFVVNEHARATTPGMPVLYERLTSQHPGAPVIYLSTGAWNVAPSLTRFLSRNLYPAGALLLTDWGPTADAWFRSGKLHKRNSLERLAHEFPQIKWLLIGDDGQHDPIIYGDFVREHPNNVTAVCIRQLSPSEAVLAGGSLREKAPSNGSQVPWLYAPDGAALADRLEGIGLLTEVAQPKQPEVKA
ncbi:MAG TPA: phosphatase domain-containing protein [Propionibacteriaceae bacterium]|nr:phosphatase domain-containing protein [Propionibacteriaceae bacterium]